MQITPVGLIPTRAGLKEKSREISDGAGAPSAAAWHSRSPTAPTPWNPSSSGMLSGKGAPGSLDNPEKRAGRVGGFFSPLGCTMD